MPAPQPNKYTNQYPKNPFTELPPNWVLISVGFLAVLLAPGGIILVRDGKPGGFVLLLISLFGIGLLVFAFNKRARAAAESANKRANQWGSRDEQWTLDLDGDRLVRSMKGETRVTRLNDIAEIYLLANVQATIGIFKGVQKYTFVTRSGERFYLDSNVFKYEELGQRLIEVMTPRLYKESQTTVRNGGVARFGPVSVSSTGITITVDRGVFSAPPTNTFAWQDVESVSFEVASGWQSIFVVHPFNRSGTKDLLEGRIAASLTVVPNIRSFIQLLKSMNARIGGTQGAEFTA